MYLCLYKDYNIFANVIIYKLKQEYAGPFKILYKYERFVYELNISIYWRVYSDFIIIMLKFYRCQVSIPLINLYRNNLI